MIYIDEGPIQAVLYSKTVIILFMIKILSLIILTTLFSKESMGSPAMQNMSTITGEIVSFEKNDVTAYNNNSGPNPSLRPRIGYKENLYWRAKVKVINCATISRKDGSKLGPEYKLKQIYEFNIPESIKIKIGSHFKGETAQTGPLPREILNVELLR